MIELRGVDAGTLVLLLLVPVLLLAVAFAGFALVLRAMGFRPLHDSPEDLFEEERWPPPRPWWGSPLLWFGVAAGFLLLGLFVAPHFLGGPVLFLPFLWIGGRRRRPRRPEAAGRAERR